MPNLLHFAVIVDRAQWLAAEGLFDVARDHYLLGAEMAREASLSRLEAAQVAAAWYCHERAQGRLPTEAS